MQRRKVAILGGGMGGLAAAFRLTSAPDWRDRFEAITIYQMGWRLGGKCATGRNLAMGARIEEHGIHGFLGSYYNALQMMRDCYGALARPTGHPLASFADAFTPRDWVTRWEFHGDGPQKTFKQWPVILRSPQPKVRPEAFDEVSLRPQTMVATWLAKVRVIHDSIAKETARALLAAQADEGAVAALFSNVVRDLSAMPRGDIEADRRALRAFEEALAAMPALAPDEPRRTLMLCRFLRVLLDGAAADNVVEKGFRQLDHLDFSEWLARHGADEALINSPLALGTLNITYQYPGGDTSRAPTMAAGAYLHWTLRTFGYIDHFIYLFNAGTGETVVAPLYELLRKRGVSFRFFHRIEALRLGDDDCVDAIDMVAQAKVKRGPDAYEPLVDVKGLACWPNRPRYEQLQRGKALEKSGIDLEGDEGDPKGADRLTLRRGEDFDDVVLAISVAALAPLTGEVAARNPAWRRMLDEARTTATQSIQVWIKRSARDMGFCFPLRPDQSEMITGNFLTQPNGLADFTPLLRFEAWPAGHEPKCLLYISGALPDTNDVVAGAPGAQAGANRTARALGVQYLQGSFGFAYPKGTTAANGVGDPISFDFSQLVCLRAPDAKGVARFDDQYWRANITPTERYVATPPGSTQFRLAASASGIENLFIAGDWIDTGINVGSVEGAVMGGWLAAQAVDRTLPRDHIYACHH